MINMSKALKVAAAIVFALTFFGVSPWDNMIALGLALFTIAEII